METKLTVDTRQFQHAMRQYAEVYGHRSAEIVNQSLYDVLVEATKWLKETPEHVDVRKFSIRQYLWFQIATRVRFERRRRSKRYGQMVPAAPRTFMPGRKGAPSNLHRIHLIVQSRRRKAGLKGLYGAEMRKAAGKLSARSQASVGYLLIPFKDALYRLNRTISRQKYKFPVYLRSLFTGIAFWKKTNARGDASAALRRIGNPEAKAMLRWNLKFSAGHAIGWINDALENAVAFKAGKLERAAAKAMQEDANRFNARRV